MATRDEIYRQPQKQIADFAFDDAVADVFGDMIRRSIPGYETVVPLAGLLIARHIRGLPAERRRVYDLGCSLGATTLAVLRHLPDLPVAVVALDNAEAMIERARTLVTDTRVEFRVADIRTLELHPAGAMVLNYVLQFISPEERLAVLQKIRNNLAPDGLLVVSEKVRFEDHREQAFHDAAHLDFKRANSYSELEISQKRAALENVMILDSDEQHRQRFQAAGFTVVRQWFQCLNWVSYLVYP